MENNKKEDKNILNIKELSKKIMYISIFSIMFFCIMSLIVITLSIFSFLMIKNDDIEELQKERVAIEFTSKISNVSENDIENELKTMSRNELNLMRNILPSVLINILNLLIISIFIKLIKFIQKNDDEKKLFTKENLKIIDKFGKSDLFILLILSLSWIRIDMVLIISLLTYLTRNIILYLFEKCIKD